MANGERHAENGDLKNGSNVHKGRIVAKEVFGRSGTPEKEVRKSFNDARDRACSCEATATRILVSVTAITLRKPCFAMTEFEIYLPRKRGDGSPVDDTIMDRIKESLTNAFGGYAELNGSPGEWSLGDLSLRDEVTILRVIDSGLTEFNMLSFKCSLEKLLGRDAILIVKREVSLVS